MKINDNHMFHGAALTQIAEHPQFTAINAFKAATGVSRSVFRINDDIGVYLKYAAQPKGPFGEYVFTFKREHLAELETVGAAVSNVFVALVCVKGRNICCLPLAELKKLIQNRRNARGEDEGQCVVLVTLPERKGFRVYVNVPGKKKTMLGSPLLIPRNDFPDKIFS